MNLPALIQRSRNAASSRKRVSAARGVDQTEKQLHLSVAQYLNIALTPPDTYTTMPLGGGGLVRGALLKAVGTKAGIPDLLILRAGRAYWIELKTKRGSLSEQQRLMAVDLKAAGCEWCVCRSVEEVEQRLTQWNFTLRAHTRRSA